MVEFLQPLWLISVVFALVYMLLEIFSSSVVIYRQFPRLYTMSERIMPYMTYGTVVIILVAIIVMLGLILL